jgi:peptidoglycan/LPS O-acetylase OafA/YrhL
MKQNFDYLDGLRGLAAIVVMMSHANEYFGLWPSHPYLAVDVFFILSGFVIAHAYDAKIISGALSFASFVKRRVFRLYPSFIFSLALACVLLVVTYAIKGQNAIAHSIFVFASTSLFIPLAIGSSAMLFAINSPYWSLFFEFIVNFVYAKFRPLLSLNNIYTLIAVSAVFVAISALNHNGLNVGFKSSIDHLVAGFSRAFFGIFLGLVLYLHRDKLLNRLPRINPAWPTLTVIALLTLPRAGNFNALLELALVFVAFPLLIVMASRHHETRLKSALLTLGLVSYPLYVIHYPIAKFIRFLIERHELHSSVNALYPLPGIMMIALMLTLSMMAVQFVETPSRAKLHSAWNALRV